MQTIKVKIAKDGTISYEVNGVKGKSCKDLTKFIDDLSTVVDSQNTCEYNARDIEQEKITSKR